MHYKCLPLLENNNSTPDLQKGDRLSGWFTAGEKSCTNASITLYVFQTNISTYLSLSGSVQKHITWAWTEVEYFKIRSWFTSNITCGFISKKILQCIYDISQNILIEKFYYPIFTDEQTRLNNKTVELWDFTYFKVENDTF